MPDYHQQAHEEKSYRRAIFLFVSLAVAGACSMYPVACFKNYSSKEKAKLDKKLRAAGTVRSGVGTPTIGTWIENAITDTTGIRLHAEPSHNLDKLPESPGSDKSTFTYHAAQQEATAEQLRSLLSVQKDNGKHSELLAKRRAGEPHTPVSLSHSDSSSGKVSSKESKLSRASSFAMLLRHNEPDYRLFKKKSQPEEHLRKHNPPSHSKPSPPRRTPSFYAPKVVEDSSIFPMNLQQSSHSLATVEMATATSQPAVSNFVLPKAREPSPRRPVKRVSTWTAEQDTRSPTPPIAPMTVTSPAVSKRPRLISIPKLPDLPKPALEPIVLPQSLQIANSVQQPYIKSTQPARSSPSPSRSHSRESERGRTRIRSSSQRYSDRSKPEEFKARHYHDVTPPNVDPSPSGHSLFRHNDHYFRTFLPETTYMKVFTPTLIPPSQDYFRPIPSSVSTEHMPLALRPTSPDKSPPPSPIVLDLLHSPAVTPAPPSTSSGSAIRPSLGQRKRGSLLKTLRRSAPATVTFEPPTIGVTHASLVSTPLGEHFMGGSSAKRRDVDVSSGSSEASTPGYFARPRLKHQSSEASSSLLSPTDVGDRGARRPQLGHSQSSSEHLSPLTLPKPKSRLRHSATLEDIQDADVSSVVPKLHNAEVDAELRFASEQLNKAVSAQEHGEASVKERKSLSWLPSEMTRLNTPPEEPDLPSTTESGELPPDKSKLGKLNGKMRTAIKQLLTGRLPGTSVIKSTGLDPPTHVPAKRGRSITPKLSVTTLLHKASLPQINKLKRKPSENPLTPPQPDQLSSRPSFDLTVTDFEQTPFFQRYGNTLRAEHNRIRNLVDATLDDDRDDELTQLCFELDVPDHLPNSPLCPLSSRHRSGGKGICPLHGRRKLAPSSPSPSNGHQLQQQRTPTKLEPRIVYEGRVDNGVESWRDGNGTVISRPGAVGDGGGLSGNGGGNGNGNGNGNGGGGGNLEYEGGNSFKRQRTSHGRGGEERTWRSGNGDASGRFS
ncbi:hypothetical protein KC356_g5004 [Hortaea werneckii]|nr:hypothetical protein KC356_g5004 [Hortaea werneckii]